MAMQGRGFFSGYPRNVTHVRRILETVGGSRKQMVRFINCSSVVILKFKMATILDLILSKSPQQVVIANVFQIVCVLCTPVTCYTTAPLYN